MFPLQLPLAYASLREGGGPPDFHEVEGRVVEGACGTLNFTEFHRLRTLPQSSSMTAPSRREPNEAGIQLGTQKVIGTYFSCIKKRLPALRQAVFFI